MKITSWFFYICLIFLLQGNAQGSKSDSFALLSIPNHEDIKLPYKVDHVGQLFLELSPLDGKGIFTFDNGLACSSSCVSQISLVEGKIGRLSYRGQVLDKAIDKKDFLSLAYGLIFGIDHTAKEVESFRLLVYENGLPDEKLKNLIKTLPNKTHPMVTLSILMNSLSSFYPQMLEDSVVKNHQEEVTAFFLGKMKYLVALTFRHHLNLDLDMNSESDLSYTADLAQMMFKNTQTDPQNPNLIRALDLLLMVHADHTMNCSTSTLRTVISSGAAPAAALASAINALSGFKHGGANEAVVKNLEHFRSKNLSAQEVIARVKNKEFLLMGFGHRVYKNYDPRALVLKKFIAEHLEQEVGKGELFDLAVQIEQEALGDSYFITKRLYPNVDYYSGMIYSWAKIPTDFFTVMFAMGRTAGWLAHWKEALNDKNSRIVRPRQFYNGTLPDEG